MEAGVTATQVAKRAAVSQTTVSLVLNDAVGAKISPATRARVHAAARELGYRPNAAAQALAGAPTKTIGLVYPSGYPHLSSHLSLLQLLEGLIEVVQQAGQRLILESVDESGNGSAFGDLARTKRIDGLAVVDGRADNPALCSLVNDGFPILLFGSVRGLQACSVYTDDRAAAHDAVEHLIALGHVRIGCITNSPLEYAGGEDRLAGYRDALAAAGLDCDERLVRHGAFTPESGYERMGSLLASDLGFTAVFVASDVVAFGALHAVTESGRRVPDDMAVASFDDVPMARFLNPPLTTVHVPAVEMGRRAGELLIGRILNTVDPVQRIRFDTTLLVRRSSTGRRDR